MAASSAVGAAVVCAVVALVLHVVRPPLPFPTAPRLMELVADEDFGRTEVAPFVEVFRGRPDLFDRVVVYKDNMGLYLAGDRTGRLGIIAAHDLLETLGVEPLEGRLLLPDEDVPGGAQSIVLSERLWKSRFGSDPSLIGSVVEIEGSLGEVTVVGIVAEDDARLPVLGRGPDFVLPFGNPGGERWTSDVSVLVRLAPGRSPKDALDWWAAVAPDLPAMPSVATGPGAEASPFFSLQSFRGSETDQATLKALAGLALAAALTLMVSVLNVAVLSWLTTVQRIRTFAVRIALGAGRSRVGFLLVRRCIVPVVCGGLLGTIATGITLARLRASAGPDLAVTVPQISPHTSALTIGVLVLFALLGIIWPMRPLLSSDVLRSLRREPGGWSGSHGGWLRWLVGTQVAVVSALVMVGALFEAAVESHISEDRGFEVQNVSFGSMTLPGGTAPADVGPVLSRLMTDSRLAGAGIAIGGPPLSRRVLGMPRVLRLTTEEDASAARTWLAPVSPEYPARLGIDAVAGRFFTQEEFARGAPVAVLDSATAWSLGQGSSLVGRAIEVWTGSEWLVVDVVGTVRPVNIVDGKTRRLVQQVYVPFTLLPSRDLSFMVDAGSAASTPPLMERLVPGAQVEPLTPFRDLYRAEAASQLFAARALGIVAMLGLILALGGLFAVLGHATEQRRREFGVRMAVGASPYSVVGLSLRSGMTLAGTGLGVGMLVAFGAGTILHDALLGVPVWDPASMALTGIVVLSSSLLACLHPALAARNSDPTELMHAE